MKKIIILHVSFLNKTSNLLFNHTMATVTQTPIFSSSTIDERKRFQIHFCIQRVGWMFEVWRLKIHDPHTECKANVDITSHQRKSYNPNGSFE